LVRREHGVLKERTSAAAVLISRGEKHGFGGAYPAHRFAGPGQGGRILKAREMLFQVGVLDARLAGGRQGISHAQDDETSAFAGVEDAGAVLKCAGLAQSSRTCPSLRSNTSTDWMVSETSWP
jgi:hypothetical protein